MQLTLGSMRATFAEALPIPLLVLSGRLTKNDAVVSLTAGSLPSNATYWPEFHNGVAAGLRFWNNNFIFISLLFYTYSFIFLNA